ncbi:MAG TPA: hypothetical protein VM367_13990, partial [Pseudonocardia sp.]|nr:hypothetical protein [Pseudonocardia sp.]
VRDLMALARAAYPDGAGREPLGALARRLGEPVRIAVLGPAESGVSTLVAALVGGEVPRSGPAGPPVPVWFRHGDAARTAMTPEGRLVVLPAVALQRMTLIDLPTVGAHPGSAAAAALLDAGRTGGPAFDALVLLLRGEADARPLRRVLPAGRSAHHPGTTVGVLAAVEVSCDGGADPAGAREAAIRLGMSSEVRPLCRTVVAVSGLLAAAAVTLRQNEFDLLREVATWPADELDHRVTAPGAFAEGPGGGDGAGPARRALLHRFGPLGVRTAAEALRTGVVSGPAGVAGVLLTASGLTRLQELLTTRVLARADTLRARSVLIGLEVLVRAAPPAGAAGERLLYQVERVRAGAHELTELDLVDELWTGGSALGPDERAAAERLLGADGPQLHLRLGVAADTAPDELRRVAAVQLGRWRERAVHPAASQRTRDVAQVLVRTCERVLEVATQG